MHDFANLVMHFKVIDSVSSIIIIIIIPTVYYHRSLDASIQYYSNNKFMFQNLYVMHTVF